VGLLLPLTLQAIPADTPVTPEASQESRALLNYFGTIYGKLILAGQHDGGRLTNGSSAELSYITNTTGRLPAMLEMDVSSYTMGRPDQQHWLMRRAADWTQHNRGIIGFCWHWRAPMGAPEFYAKDTAFDITRATTPGTAEYTAVLRDMDSIASELAMLRDAHVAVLWRPLHEANGRWFWWGMGGPEPFKKLWRMMFENFTTKHHLNNLIWVFSPGAETDLADWYPGDAFVDIIGQDHYPMDGNHASAKDIFDELSHLTRGQKFIALGENGPIPDPALMQRDQAGWLYFCTWSGSILTEKTTAAQLREYYNNPRVITLADLPDWRTRTAKPTGKAMKLTFVGAPGDVALGGTWRTPVSVAVQDQDSQTVREGTYAVTLGLTPFSRAKLCGPLTATTVNGLATFDGVTIDAAVQCRFTAEAPGIRSTTSAPFSVGPGSGLKCEQWTNAKDFSTAPDDTETLNIALETPVRLATNYSARILGCITAPESGIYHFSMASGCSSELWLGTNALPTSAVQIATVTSATPYRKWPHTNEADSPPLPLMAGYKYYFEIRRWQKQGSTQLRVRWQLPDGSEERPIPAFRFEPLKLEPTL
jgi:mannan endo-1,4-beta-mannosidase